MKIIYLFIIITLIPLISQKQFLNIFEKKKEAIILASTDLETIRNNNGADIFTQKDYIDLCMKFTNNEEKDIK